MTSFRTRSSSEMPRIRRRQRIWNTSSFCVSGCRSVHHSAPYSRTERINDRYGRIFVSRLMFVFRQRHHVGAPKAVAAAPIRLFTSSEAATFPSRMIEQRHLNWGTCSNCTPSRNTWPGHPSVVRTLVLSVLILRPKGRAASCISRRIKEASWSSSANIALSSAYIRSVMD